MIEDHSRRKHPYNPGWSYGNVMSTIGIVAGGVAVFVLMQVTSARADEKVIALQAQVSTDRETTAKRLDALQTQVTNIDQKSNMMAEKQATLLANIEMLMRSQGLRPVGVDK